MALKSNHLKAKVFTDERDTKFFPSLEFFKMHLSKTSSCDLAENNLKDRYKWRESSQISSIIYYYKPILKRICWSGSQITAEYINTRP